MHPVHMWFAFFFVGSGDGGAPDAFTFGFPIISAIYGLRIFWISKASYVILERGCLKIGPICILHIDDRQKSLSVHSVPGFPSRFDFFWNSDGSHGLPRLLSLQLPQTFPDDASKLPEAPGGFRCSRCSVSWVVWDTLRNSHGNCCGFVVTVVILW